MVIKKVKLLYRKIAFSNLLAAQKLLIIAGVLLPAGFACQTGETEKLPPPVIRDTSITEENAFINVFIDSAELTSFLSKARLPSGDSAQVSDFYKSRNYQFAWFDSVGLTEHASSFVSLYRNFRTIGKDSSLVNRELDANIDHIMDDSSFITRNKQLKVPVELGLTRQFFIYASKAYLGNATLDPGELGWFIPKKKINIRSFLDSIVSNKHARISDFEPVHPMFTPLHEYLQKYSSLAKNDGWPMIPEGRKPYREKDSSLVIGLIKKRLQAVGDLPASDSGNVFTKETREGVVNFQHRYGLEEDGVAGKKVISQMNRPVTDRVKQIIVNIERIRWIPKQGNGRYIVANIPAFKLYAFDSGRLQWDMKVVVGSQANNTVVFSDVIETIAFSPYWNIPYSIVKNELANKSKGYFQKNNMEFVGNYSDGLPRIRQKPGPGNALGNVKFLFPNSYSIYFHDTPAKGLFSRPNRAASHGCIRLEEPKKMAEWLLDYDPNWTKDSIQQAMALAKEKQVKLKRTVPVYIVYFTAWVDGAGRLNFRDDVYGHDKAMIEKLFEQL